MIWIQCWVHIRKRNVPIPNRIPCSFAMPRAWSVTSKHSVMENISEIAKAEEDLKYATRFVKPILATIGAWPISSSTSFFLKALQRLGHIFTYFLFFLIMIPTLAYVFLKEKNSKVRLKLMGPIINCSMQFFKYTIIIWRRKEIQEGLHAIRHDWIKATEEERLIFRSKMKIGRRVVLIAAFTMYGGGLCYRTILPLLKGTVITADNITIRPLPCPSYFIIINEQQSPIYEILFVLQVMAGMAIYAVISGTCGISALLVLHACSMLRILVNKIKKLVNKSDMSEVTLQRKIMDIVEYQMKIKRWVKIFQNDKFELK